MTDTFWCDLRDQLGISAVLTHLDHLHEHHQRTERNMAKLADELDDISRRITAMRDAQTASTTNVRDALTRMEQRITELQSGELNSDQQAVVDQLKADVDAARTAAEAADDGYEPPLVEPAPVPGVEGEPQPGAIDEGDRRGL